MTNQRTFVLTAVIAIGGGRPPLLSMASMLHGRGVEVIDADMSRPARGHQTFNATFVATPSQANTVLHSIENQIDVVEAYLFDALDMRRPADVPVSLSAKESELTPIR